MPKRTDIQKILIIGSGPIIIGQACEFDYSGTQACKALREEGYEITLVNSNPATIMTDPEIADQTYVEPIFADTVAKIIEKERPQALLPTLGGQTGLNVAVELAEKGVLDQFQVELIGAKLPAIRMAEDRELFKNAMLQIGLDVPESGIARSLESAMEIVKNIGFPAIIRPAFTLGGTGGGIAYNIEEYRDMIQQGIALSPVNEVLVEESVIGWKEFELEVMRDRVDNVVIICSIENFDAMGVHTGDSITVAPAQTLSDKEYQVMRNSAIQIIRKIGVDTGGSNIQFAVDPDSGRQTVIEMNPRVSRSSALASKATGFPIAKIAAKLAVGYTLDEIPNDITKKTPSSFEPTIDYVVAKIPRWAFEKFPGTDETLTTRMKSVGEAMSIGRTFKEAIQKGLRSLENGWTGLDNHLWGNSSLFRNSDELISKLNIPNVERIFYIKHAFQFGMTIEQIYNHTKVDPFFLYNIKELVDFESELKSEQPDLSSTGQIQVSSETSSLLLRAKRFGFSDPQIAELWETDEKDIRSTRQLLGIVATFKTVDTCAAEFEAETPYYYSTYGSEDEVRPSDKKKIMILGSGPNRIGQGIEFDYCCVHAAMAVKADGYETIMINSNPETVSTDYDTSDRLYFEPLTFEDVMNIVEREKIDGAIVQFGGQTPLNLAMRLKQAGVPIIGTDPSDIERAEDRQLFKLVLDQIGVSQPPSDTATSVEAARPIAERIGYPVLVRPSFVLGGRAMQIVYDRESLDAYMEFAVQISSDSAEGLRETIKPILIDKYLEDAIEVDVDAISDGELTLVGGVMEHIEEAGIHSGDSDCVLPPYTLAEDQIERLKQISYELAKGLNVLGLMNIQFAIKNEEVYVLEVNPRASRTIPFVSKSIGIPLAKLAARIMVGKKLSQLGFKSEIEPEYFSVKAPVFPFNRFPGANSQLGPEMKSTGEVMGIDRNLDAAFAKAQKASGAILPLSGQVFISVRNRDKRSILLIARKLHEMGFNLVATHGTAKVLRRSGLSSELVYSIGKGRPTIYDFIKNSEIDMIINTPTGYAHRPNEQLIRQMAIDHNIPIFTTMPGASAAVNSISVLRDRNLDVVPLQEYAR